MSFLAEDLLLINAVMSILAGLSQLSAGLDRSYDVRRRAGYMAMATICLFIGSVYGLTLLGYIDMARVSLEYLRPAIPLLMLALFFQPMVEPEGAEEIRKEMDRIISSMREEFDREKNLLLSLLAEAQARVISLTSQLDEITDELMLLRMTHANMDDSGKATKTDRQGDNEMILVGIGPEPGLDFDLSVLRKVRADTGLPFKRLSPITKRNFKRHIDRYRMLGRPVRYLHLGCHMGDEGIQFADGIVSPEWLGRQIGNDVEVVVLAGCTSDKLGDLIPAEYVITFSEDLPMTDAPLFAEAFWGNIGHGMSPSEAFNNALEKVPAYIGEYIERHW